MISESIRCPSCGWYQVCDDEAVIAHLAQVGLARPGHRPDPDFIAELFGTALQRLECPDCGRRGLCRAEQPEADWPVAPVCGQCGAVISAERLAAVPGAQFCAACQAHGERSSAETEEFCPRCGAAMKIVPATGGGITRYRYQCTGNPPCRGS